MRHRFSAPLLLATLLAAAPAFAQNPSAPVPGGATTPAPVASASARSGMIGLDAMTATVFQQGQSSFSGIALRLRMRHSRLVPNIEIMPTLEFWQNTSRVSAFDIEVKRRDAAFSADARWAFHNRPWVPYAGLGFGLHFLDNEVRAPKLGMPLESEALIKGGVDLLAGVQSNPDTRLGSFLELKFLGVAKYRQLKINTGLNWNF